MYYIMLQIDEGANLIGNFTIAYDNGANFIVNYDVGNDQFNSEDNIMANNGMDLVLAKIDNQWTASVSDPNNPVHIDG